MEYPVGFGAYHPNDNVNYQINRWLPGAEPAEFLAAAQGASLDTWRDAMMRLGDQAVGQGRALNASTYYRAAEFFLPFEDPNKMEAYRRYREQIARVDVGLPYERVDVPFRGGALPAYRFAARGERRDTIVIHGGFDSYAEEFLFWGAEFAGFGFEVIIFEGPGQGGAVRDFGLTMDRDWHKPLGAVLDRFGMVDCTLIGLSLGGCLAPRAAAFEPRVRRLIALDILFDFFDCFAVRLGSAASAALSRRLASGEDEAVEALFARMAQAQPTLAWAAAHGRSISGAAGVADYLRWLKGMTTADISAAVTQDVLILAGTEDHIVPLDQFHRQAAALTNVRSLTARLFTEAEHGQAHCQVGALRLVLDTMRAWIEGCLARRDAVPRAA
jgi:pimeloyl-ACP methyl ester carboxylesterase